MKTDKENKNPIRYRGSAMEDVFYSRASFSGPPRLRLCSAPQAQGTKCSAPWWEGPITARVIYTERRGGCCLPSNTGQGGRGKKGREKCGWERKRGERGDCVCPNRTEGATGPERVNLSMGLIMPLSSINSIKYKNATNVYSGKNKQKETNMYPCCAVT